MKYDNSGTHCLKVISKSKVFKKLAKVKVKDVGTHRKVLSQKIIILNIKALALTVQKL